METIILNCASHVALIFFLYFQYVGACRRADLIKQLSFVMVFLICTEFGKYQGINDMVIVSMQVLFLIGSGIMITKEMNKAILITTFNGIATALPGRIVGNIMILYASDIDNPMRWIMAVIVSLAFHVLVLYFILKYIGIFFDSIKRDRDFPWSILIVIPVLYYIAIYMLMNFPMNFWDQPLNMAIAEVVSMIVIFAYMLMIQTIKYQKNNSMLFYTNQEYEIMISQMEGRIELNMDKQKQAAIARHDLRHVNNVVRQLIEEGQTEMAVSVLDAHDAEMENLAMKTYCKNVVINSVLEFSASRCKELKINLDIQADLPVKLSVPDLELAVVISNMIENAIKAVNAVKADRWIEFLSMKKGDKQIVQITNPFLGTIKYNEHTGLPISEQGAGHGLGMQSIETFTKKHGAVFDCQDEDGIFVARLLLQGGEDEEEEKSLDELLDQ